MDNRGSLVVISGFSGSGKGTVMKELLKRYDSYALSISATTRNPRPGEADGVDYFFKTKEEFEQMIAENKLLEYAKYVENYYGTPKDYVYENLDAGRDVLLEIEIQGALQIKEKFPDAILMFLTAPSAEELKRRLIGRGTETPDVIDQRMKRAINESELMDKYDYLIVNDTVDACVEEVNRLISSLRRRTTNHMEFVGTMKEQLKNI